MNDKEIVANQELLNVLYSMLDTFSIMEEHLEKIAKKLSGIEMNTNNIV